VWYRRQSRVTCAGAEAADVDRHHVLDAAGMSHAAMAWPPGSRATTSQYAHSGWQAPVRSEVIVADALSPSSEPLGTNQASGLRCRSQSSPRLGAGPTFTGIVSAVTADRIAIAIFVL
jgi:hypothetical protein